MGFDPDFDRHGPAKVGRDNAPRGALAALIAITAVAMSLGACCLLSDSFRPDPEPAAVKVATPEAAAPVVMPAQSTPSPAPGSHLIVNRETGYCLDIPYGLGEPRTPVEQFPVNGGGNQRWRLEPVPGGAVRVVNEWTGQCLDVPHGTTEPVAVEQYTRHDGPNQGWRLEEAGDGWYRIVNQLTGLCLQVAGESPVRRAKVEQARPGDSPYQRWRVIAVR